MPATLESISPAHRQTIADLLGLESQDAPFRRARSFPASPADLDRRLDPHQPPSPVLAYSLRIYQLAKDTFESASTLREAAIPTSRWYHQIHSREGGEALGYARTRWEGDQWVLEATGRTAPADDRADSTELLVKRWLDEVADDVEGDRWRSYRISVLEIPSVNVLALWFKHEASGGESDRVVVVGRPRFGRYLDEFPTRVDAPSPAGGFLSQLRDVAEDAPMTGIVLPTAAA